MCLFLAISLLSQPAYKKKPLQKKKLSKLKISVLTDVITIFNMPVNIDEGER